MKLVLLAHGVLTSLGRRNPFVAPPAARGAPACAWRRPLSPDTRFDGERAKDLKLVVPAPCEFRPGLSLATDTLSAGTYRPAFEDDDGIYFQGSDKVYVRSLIGIALLHDGGIYVSRDRDTIWLFFINHQGNLERHTLPETCHYSIEACSDCELARAG